MDLKCEEKKGMVSSMYVQRKGVYLTGRGKSLDCTDDIPRLHQATLYPHIVHSRCLNFRKEAHLVPSAYFPALPNDIIDKVVSKLFSLGRSNGIGDG